MPKPPVINETAAQAAVDALVTEVSGIRAAIAAMQAREAALMAATLGVVQAAAVGARPGRWRLSCPCGHSRRSSVRRCG